MLLPVPAAGTTLPVATTGPALTKAAAQAAYKKGAAALSAGKLLEARAELSRAYFSGQLDKAAEADAVKLMTDVFDKTIVSREILDGDPYVMYYMFKPGDTLVGARGVERTQELHVPMQFLLRINGLSRGEDIRAGQTVKLVRGPFHAIVSKSAFTITLYLERFDPNGVSLGKVFACRLPVGLGKNGSTPLGSWRVRLGSKTERQPWYPPPSSNLMGPIQVDDPRYAFGPKGLWIGLEGTEGATELLTDIGIHSTSDANSIGTNSSLGCIRLRDADIERVYSMLYEKWSTVRIVP